MNKKLIVPIATLIILVVVAGVIILTRDSENETTTAPTVPTVGLLVQSEIVGQLLKRPLTELGYVEGETIQYMVALIDDTQADEAAVQSLIDANVTAIFASSPTIVRTANSMTTTIPIVFLANQFEFSNEIAPQLVEREGGTNVTGVISTNAAEKQFELLMEIAPSTEVVYVPYDPNNALSVTAVRLIEDMAPRYDVTLETFEFGSNAGAEQALEDIPENADAIFLLSEPPILLNLTDWAELSVERGAPATISLGQVPGGFFPPGILMGYGASLDELYQQAAELFDQILQGIDPADLPPRPSDVFLTVSLGAADALDITVPSSVLDQATYVLRDEVAVPTTGDSEQTATISDVACNAILTSLLGENNVCMTMSCDLVEDTTFASFTDKVEVDACSTEDLLGICSAGTSDSYFYGGDAALLEGGCAANGGEWKTSTE